MRDLKFRVWNNNRFIKSDYYLKIDTGDIFSHERDYGGTFSSHEKLWFEKGIIQQYTGFKDSEGKEIYEGDILSHNVGLGPLYWEVIWNSTEGRWMTTKLHGGNTPSWFDCYTIAGNIFETPELLKL